MGSNVMVDAAFVLGCLTVALGLVVHWITHNPDT